MVNDELALRERFRLFLSQRSGVQVVPGGRCDLVTVVDGDDELVVGCWVRCDVYQPMSELPKPRRARRKVKARKRRKVGSRKLA